MIEFFFDFLIDIFLFLFPVFIIARSIKSLSLRKILPELGIKNCAPKFFFNKTIQLFLMLFGLAFLLGLALYAIGIRDTGRVFEAIDAIKTLNIFFLFYLLVVRVTGEEVFFRGLLTKKIGIVPSSAAFALVHALYGSIGEVIGAFVLGVLLAKMFIKNNNLMPNIFAHIFYNFFVLLIVYSVPA